MDNLIRHKMSIKTIHYVVRVKSSMIIFVSGIECFGALFLAKTSRASLEGLYGDL